MKESYSSEGYQTIYSQLEAPLHLLLSPSLTFPSRMQSATFSPSHFWGKLSISLIFRHIKALRIVLHTRIHNKGHGYGTKHSWDTTVPEEHSQVSEGTSISESTLWKWRRNNGTSHLHGEFQREGCKEWENTHICSCSNKTGLTFHKGSSDGKHIEVAIYTSQRKKTTQGTLFTGHKARVLVKRI